MRPIRLTPPGWNDHVCVLARGVLTSTAGRQRERSDVNAFDRHALTALICEHIVDVGAVYDDVSARELVQTGKQLQMTMPKMRHARHGEAWGVIGTSSAVGGRGSK